MIAEHLETAYLVWCKILTSHQICRPTYIALVALELRGGAIKMDHHCNYLGEVGWGVNKGNRARRPFWWGSNVHIATPFYDNGLQDSLSLSYFWFLALGEGTIKQLLNGVLTLSLNAPQAHVRSGAFGQNKHRGLRPEYTLRIRGLQGTRKPNRATFRRFRIISSKIAFSWRRQLCWVSILPFPPLPCLDFPGNKYQITYRCYSYWPLHRLFHKRVIF